MTGLRFAFFGSSLVSSYWNGACTYYRGIISALHARGHTITFFEPHAYERQEHRDIDDPDYAEVVVYEPTDADAVRAVVRQASGADVVVKTSGVGVFDDVLEEAVLELGGHATRIFWDVDAPATLAALESDPDAPLRRLVVDYDLVLTYGGGRPVVERYTDLGARMCEPIYNALDPQTHHRVSPRAEFACDLAFLGNRLPDREARVEEFFFRAVELAPEPTFLLGGSGWQDRVGAPNLRYVGHVSTRDHNALNSSPLAVLNVSRSSMAANGWSPATRVFEAAGAGACLISDTWPGIEEFLEPRSEVLLARDGADVAELLATLEPEQAHTIGQAALERVRRKHTYAQRAERVEEVLSARWAGRAA